MCIRDRTWDLRESEPGAEFIVSGMVTCDGDMDPSNDILNPTTVIVVDEPPPPPPPVASHKSQHEDGGSDELDLTGLHGVIATPQPYADHAAKHQDEGDDQLNVGGLAGALADPQIPSDHGNERHIEEYATEGLLTAHKDDPGPHDAATTLEKVANKGQVDGYAELDGSGVVPPAQLGSGGGALKFLRHDSTWQPAAGTVGPLPGWPPRFTPSDGVGVSAMRNDASPAVSGGIDWNFSTGQQYFAQTVKLLDALIPGATGLPTHFVISPSLFGMIQGSLPRNVSFSVRLGIAGGIGDYQLCALAFASGPGLAGSSWTLRGDVFLSVGGSLGNAAAGFHMTYPTAGGGVVACKNCVFDIPSWNWAASVDNHLTVHMTVDGDPANYVTRAACNAFLVHDQ